MKPDWGDSVRVRVDVPEGYRPGEIASVVGFRELGVLTLVLIEFGDGASIEIPLPLLGDVEDENE